MKSSLQLTTDQGELEYARLPIICWDFISFEVTYLSLVKFSFKEGSYLKEIDF